MDKIVRVQIIANGDSPVPLYLGNEFARRVSVDARGNFGSTTPGTLKAFLAVNGADKEAVERGSLGAPGTIQQILDGGRLAKALILELTGAVGTIAIDVEILIDVID